MPADPSLIRARGDYLEKQFADSILSRIPSYATFWATYVGNDGQQQQLPMPGADAATMERRELIWQHLYSLFESLALCWRIEDEFKDREQVNTLADYAWQLNAWTAFYAHLGRIHDMAERVTEKLGQNHLFAPFDHFYEQRHIALHGLKVPMRWVENVLTAPPLGEEPRQWHGKVWSDLQRADFEFLSRTISTTLRSLEQVVEAFLTQVLGLAASHLHFQPIEWENRITVSEQIVGGTDPYSAGALGRGWRHIFETRVLPSRDFSPLGDTDTLGLMSWDGSIETWDADRTNGVSTGSYHTRSKVYRGELAISGAECRWTTPERLVYVFRRPDSGDNIVMRGRLVAIRDFNGNSVQISYNELVGEITDVIDTARGRYEFFHTNGLLRRITFGAWSVHLGYDATNRLISISKTNSSGLYAPVNTTLQFSYNSSNSLLERVIDPRGNTTTTVVYDKYGRRIEERDALSRLARTEYGVPGKRQIRRTDAETNIWIETFDRQHRLLSRKDPLGNETQNAYDEASNLISITEPLGYKTFMAYDSRANLTGITNALGEISRRTSHTNFNKGVQEIDPLGWTNNIVIDDNTGNLLRNYDALGELSRYRYTPNGLVETLTDGNGNVTRMFYDTNGFLIAQIDSANYTNRYAYNELGWKIAETNALGEVTTFAHDLNGNVVRTTDSLSRTFIRTYDGNGNLISQSDAKGRFTFFFYDAANQRTQMVDRASNVWRYTFTLRGQPFTTTDPEGFSSTNFYDPANRVIAISDALGNTVSNRYDANGKITNMIDQVGQRWSKTYDALGRVIAETDPQGDTRRTTFDAANRVKQITTPNGYPSLHEYDGRARLRKWTDAENFVWRYDYDGIQNITNITDALGDHYVMAYGARNERILERNQDGFEWRYEYDALGRLKVQRDPNKISTGENLSRTLVYDAGGRILSVEFNTGRVNTFIYDNNNNPEFVSRIGSGPTTTTSLKYDELDRVIETTDTFSRRLRFGYDRRGLRTTLTYPDDKVLTNRFDAIGRLTNQLDWAGRQTTYAYDRVGRLIRRSYPNGVVQTNTFDIAGQLTGLSYGTTTLSSNSVSIALSYAYDRNGNKVGSSEKGTAQWPLPSLQDEQARFTPAGRLIDRQVTPLDPLTTQPATLNYRYDASGNMIAATNRVGGVAAQIWRLTYDEDNRTTSIFSDSGISSKTITNRYDALGRRVARTMDGVETRYTLDLAGGMERILCDANQSGITAWYVHGPDLAYKVDPANNVICYHADAQANIIALTDGSANAVAQYAYTPYGRVLGPANYQAQASNPFLFVGSQGVMEELSGLYFMRARYYLADAGVFLSTDPVKAIGAKWRPVAYEYAAGNPMSAIDPNGLWPNWDNYIGAGWVGGTDDRPEERYSDQEFADMLTRVPPANSIDRGAYWHDRRLALATRQGDFSAALRANDALYMDAIRGIGTELLRGNFGNAAKGIVVAAGFADTGLGFSIGDAFQAKAFLGHALRGGAKSAQISALPVGSGVDLSPGAYIDGLRIVGPPGPPPPPGGPGAGGALSSKAVQAGHYANSANAIQGAVAKLATQGISLAAPFIGGFVADAFGRILPKSTPPVLREAAKFLVAKAATSVVTAAAPYVGAAVGVAVAAAVSTAKVVVSIVVAIFGVPKPLIFVLAFIGVVALFEYWRYRRRRRRVGTFPGT